MTCCRKVITNKGERKHAAAESFTAGDVQVLVAILAAFVALAIALAPQVAEAQAVPPTGATSRPTKRRTACRSGTRTPAGSPRVPVPRKREPVRHRAPGTGRPPTPLEVTYWAAETSMPVGNAGGEALLVMAVEGAEDPDAGNAPITGAVISIRRRWAPPEHALQGEPPLRQLLGPHQRQGRVPEERQHPRRARMRHRGGSELQLPPPRSGSPLFDNFLRPANVPWSTTRTHLSNPEVPVRVVGSLVRNANNQPQNYFQIEGPSGRRRRVTPWRGRTGSPSSPSSCGTRTWRPRSLAEVGRACRSRQILHLSRGPSSVGRAPRDSALSERPLSHLRARHKARP